MQETIRLDVAGLVTSGSRGLMMTRQASVAGRERLTMSQRWAEPFAAIIELAMLGGFFVYQQIAHT